ncbi:MAG: MGMT family protein [archaeon]
MMLKDKVYNNLKKVPKGRVTTYKELAHASDTNAYRVIGQLMKNNPYAPTVPCHRVVASDGTIGGFGGEKSGPSITRKIKMLKDEGIRFNGNKILDFDKVLFKF